VALRTPLVIAASGTTRYEWDGVPEIWRSRAWFPFLVAARRARGPVDVVLGAAVVLALYALTAVLKGQPAVASGLWRAIEGTARDPGPRAARPGI
jgi:hypothetical protein